MKLRFVLAECCGYRTILVSTDLSMSPLSIIGLYGMRFGIESMFREFNQVICGFGYHFWTKKWPKLNRWAKKGSSDPLDKVTDKKSRERILLAFKATEGFAFVSIVAQGLLQLLSLSFQTQKKWQIYGICEHADKTSHPRQLRLTFCEKIYLYFC